LSGPLGVVGGHYKNIYPHHCIPSNKNNFIFLLTCNAKWFFMCAMSETNTKPKPVYIAPDLHRRLKSEAAKTGKTLADHIAAILAKRRAVN
jgi:hypothetical protein